MHSVVIETIKKLLEKNYKIDNICCLLPTSILVREDHLKKSFKLLKKNSDKFIIGICRFPSPPQKGFLLNHMSQISLYDKKRLFNKTQNYKPVYHDAGQLYWGKHKNYLKYKDFRKIYLNNKSIGFVMNEKEVQDIDTIEDLNMARIKFLINKKKLA